MLTLDEAKDWLGVTGDDSNAIINSLIIAADEDLKSKVGDYNQESESAKLYMKWYIALNFNDRLGELSNKEKSAVSSLMQNKIFNLRLECESNDNNE